MTDEQLRDLERICDDEVEILQWADSVHCVEEIAPVISECEIIAAVLPLELLYLTVKAAGEKPVLISVSKRLPSGKIRVMPDGKTEREYVFVHDFWQRIVRFELELARL